jgi:hypothetical protein
MLVSLTIAIEPAVEGLAPSRRTSSISKYPNLRCWRCRAPFFAEILRRIRGRSSHDRVALDTGIGKGDVCPESAD